MFKRIGLLGMAAALGWACVGQAATLTVTTSADEANCLCNSSGCSTKPGCDISANPQSFPLSTGCSLREALQDIADAAGAQTITYQECGTPDTTGNTIVLAANAIDIYGAVPDPTDSTGAAMTHNTQLPFILKSADAGTYTITGGTISCEYDPKAVPAVGGNSIFTTTDGSSLQFQGTSFMNCTSSSDGVAVQNEGNSSGDLTMTGVTFTNLHAVNQGNGGCIAHGSGNLAITGGSFTGCIVDDGGLVPGGGNGQGGAIYMAGAGGATRVAISGVTFQGNIAGTSGGAIYMSNTDAVAIDTSAFQGNIAAGNTFDSGNAEQGGGAIYATGTATGGNDGSVMGINASAFLIFQSSFIANLAPNGTGGAILLTGGGKLTPGTLSVNVGDYQSGVVGSIPGGVVASNFSGNIASGTWNTPQNNPSARAGSGGAIYASGEVAIIASSFVGANSSSNASGGAIAYYDPTDAFAPMSIANTTFNGNNAAVNGGAIANIKDPANNFNGEIALVNDTLAGDSASGGGGELFNVGAAADVQISNSILANAGSGGNCSGPVTDVAGNVQYPGNDCGGMTVGDPKLGSPALFGGKNALVLTMDLGSGSAASRHGDQATCAAAPIYALDEALNDRPSPSGTNCDSGALEVAIVPDLTIQKSHTDPFVKGETGDTYTITVTNSGNDSTSGTVTVTDTLPAGLTATDISGTGWSCDTPTLTCTRSDVLGASASYPDITLTVNVDSQAATGMVDNTASVSGGGEVNDANDGATDPTTINPLTPVTLQSFEVD